MTLKVNKLQAAHRQLDVAIRLHFANDDPLAILTLVGAASRIFSDLVESIAPDRSWDRKGWEANEISKKEYFAAMRRGQDFLKHADFDPDGILDWSEEGTESLIFSATLNAGEIGDTSTSQQMFQIWFLATYGKSVGPNNKLAKHAAAIFPRMSNMSTEERKAAGAERLAGVLKDPELSASDV